MENSGERYLPETERAQLTRSNCFISYEHWHRYRYAAPFVVGKTVLDIASGEGYGSAFLAAGAAQVYGVDRSEEAVQHARQAYVRDNLQFLQGSADAIPISGQHCLDVIVSFETIEHLDSRTQEQFAAEVKRLLKPDGILLISTPNRTLYTDTRDQKNPYHINEYNTDEFSEFLLRHFKHVKMFGQHVYPVSCIWSLDNVQGTVAESRMAYRDGAFRSVEEDGKEAVYLIAVCSDRGEFAAGPDSHLVDLTEVAFQGIPDHEQWRATSLFIDSGAGFRTDEVVRQEAAYRPGFALRFDLDGSMPARQLRWDPLEMCLCRVRLHQVLWQDSEGRISRLDLGQVTSNGIRRDEATFEFETLDPMIYLPISGRVASVTIEGECIAADGPATLAGLEQVAQKRAQQSAHQDQELRTMRRQLGMHEELVTAYRHQLALRDQELELARQKLGAQEQSIVKLSRDLEDRAQQIQHLEWVQGTLKDSLKVITQSRRWILINRVQDALYFLPRLLRSTWKRVFGTGRHEQRTTVAVPARWHSLTDRGPGRDSRPNQETESAIRD